MQKKEKVIEKIEYVYVANDGTEFKDETECIKYEATAKGVINNMFHKIPKQTTECVGEIAPICEIGYEHTIYAIKINDINELESINKWLFVHGNTADPLSAEEIGTIQLFEQAEYETDVWRLGTPDEFKKRYCDAIDSLYNRLYIEKKED